MYIYKVRQNGYWKDYSNEYECEMSARVWFGKYGEFLSALSNRKIVLFKNTKKVK